MKLRFIDIFYFLIISVVSFTFQIVQSTYQTNQTINNLDFAAFEKPAMY